MNSTYPNVVRASRTELKTEPSLGTFPLAANNNSIGILQTVHTTNGHGSHGGTLLSEAQMTFHKWLGADFDRDVLNAVLATVASQHLDGDPLWTLVVAGPGAGKTEVVSSLAGAGAHIVSTITSEGALLSASSRKDKAKGSTGGLLRAIGDRGILVIKDVTSILSQQHNNRAGVLAALREVHDGRWVRNVGTDGGRTLTWTGRITLVGAVTTAWDSAHSVISVMGDRFVLVRLDSTRNRQQSGQQAIRNLGSEVQMRAELSDAVRDVIAGMNRKVGEVTEEERDRLFIAADIVTRARTAVDRDYASNIVNSHAPEMPTRFLKQLAMMVRGGVAIGMDREDAMSLALRAARDSMPPLRLSILLDVDAHPGARPNDVSRHLNKPWTTVKRELEGLQMLGLLDCEEESDDLREKRVWRYSLAKATWNSDGRDGLDRETLRCMRGQGVRA